MQKFQTLRLRPQTPQPAAAGGFAPDPQPTAAWGFATKPQKLPSIANF